MNIESRSAVSIRFKMTNSEGEILENILDGPAITYIHGSGNILPDLEQELFGLTTGDKKVFTVSKEQGYATDDDYTMEVVIDNVRAATEEEWRTGVSLATTTVECEEGCIC